jgi:predicted CopG family antitoxin
MLMKMWEEKGLFSDIIITLLKKLRKTRKAGQGSWFPDQD